MGGAFRLETTSCLDTAGDSEGKSERDKRCQSMHGDCTAISSLTFNRTMKAACTKDEIMGFATKRYKNLWEKNQGVEKEPTSAGSLYCPLTGMIPTSPIEEPSLDAL